MKLKTLAVITLVVSGYSFALAQAPGTFTFWNTGATLSYDDYLVITYNSGGIVAGYEDLSIFGDANAPSLVSSLPPVKMASQGRCPRRRPL